MASFYRCFIFTFDELSAPITDWMKSNQNFNWTPEAEKSFQVIKKRLLEAPLLVLPDFEKMFEVHFDASQVWIGAF